MAQPAGDDTRYSDEAAGDRLLRLFARFVSAGFAIYLLVLGMRIVDQSQVAGVWWTAAALLVVFGPALAILPASFRQDTTLIRRLLVVVTIGYPAIILTWPWMLDGVTLGLNVAPWWTLCVGLAPLAGALVWPPSASLIYLVAITATGAYVEAATASPLSEKTWFVSFSFGVTFCGIFVCAAIVGMRTGRVLDAATAVAGEQAAVTAAERARAVERERFDALVHDDIMATVLAASRSNNTALLTRQATGALEQLSALRSGSESTPFTGAELIGLLRSAATEVNENTEFTASLSDHAASVRISRSDARTVSAAMVEALRNSERHAGGGAHRSVAVVVGADRLDVTVTDDGVGFDPGAVPRDRLGIAVSIRKRMTQTPDGHAEIVSSPGAGTIVRLSASIDA